MSRVRTHKESIVSVSDSLPPSACGRVWSSFGNRINMRDINVIIIGARKKDWKKVGWRKFWCYQFATF
jgi:hypothetical protein